MRTMPAMVAVEDVTVSIGATDLVDAVTLTVRAGSFVALCGPNGSGKSTLLRCIHRAARPRRGVIMFDGADIASRSPRALARQVGVVLQERADELDFTVRDMVAMGREPHTSFFGALDDSDHLLVDASLERVGLGSLAARAYRTLSGGERQRVLVARALAQQTALLLLDEPTNHLDLRFQIEILDLVRALGITVVAALHDLQLAARFCDEVHLLDRGRLVRSGRPADVLTPPALLEVFGVDATVHDIGGRLFFDYRLPSEAKRDDAQKVRVPR
jgi:iron complex transport system ATP-binding protein